MPPERWFRWDGDDLILQVHVQPHARQDVLVGVTGDHLKIRLKASPVEGQANRSLITLLAKHFAVPKTHVALVRGHAGRHKTIRIRSPKQFPAAICSAFR